GGYVWAFDAATGNTAWGEQVANASLNDGFFAPATTDATGEVIYITSFFGGNLFALNATTGGLLWRTDNDERLSAAWGVYAPLEKGDAIFVAEKATGPIGAASLQ